MVSFLTGCNSVSYFEAGCIWQASRGRKPPDAFYGGTDIPIYYEKPARFASTTNYRNNRPVAPRVHEGNRDNRAVMFKETYS